MDSSRIVEMVHTRLLVRYGVQWNRLYEGIDPAAVKADWIDQIGGLNPNAIRYALDNLPADRPPNAGRFKALCMEYRAPERPYQALPRPKATPEDRERVRAMLAKAKAAITGKTA